MGISHSSRYSSGSNLHGNRSLKSRVDLKPLTIVPPMTPVTYEEEKTVGLEDGMFLPENSNVKSKDHFGVFKYGRNERSVFSNTNNPYIN